MKCRVFPVPKESQGRDRPVSRSGKTSPTGKAGPNPISLHTVSLLSVQGNVLRVGGMDAVDGTPVLDIKPHDPERGR
jgi:tRNA (Thr-GGU) A37 N-methylase